MMWHCVQTFDVFILGRIVTGVGVGLFSSTIFLYSSELSPPHIRGRLATANQARVWLHLNFSGFDWRGPLGAAILRLSVMPVLGFFSRCLQLCVCIGILMGYIVDKEVTFWRHTLVRVVRGD